MKELKKTIMVMEKMLKGRKLQHKAELRYYKQNPYDPDKHKRTRIKIIRALSHNLSILKRLDEKKMISFIDDMVGDLYKSRYYAKAILRMLAGKEKK